MKLNLSTLYLKLRNTTCSCKIQRNGGCWFTCNESYASGPSLFKGNDISDKSKTVHKFWARKYMNIEEKLKYMKSGIFGWNAGKMLCAISSMKLP